LPPRPGESPGRQRPAGGAGTGPSGGGGRRGGLSRGEPIRPDSVLGDILAAYPETEKVFKRYYGAGCFSCPGQATESVKQSAMMHNVNEKEILTELNRAAGF
jgi:hybrid cluster-associated redox disulfide protein